MTVDIVTDWLLSPLLPSNQRKSWFTFYFGIVTPGRAGAELVCVYFHFSSFVLDGTANWRVLAPRRAALSRPVPAHSSEEHVYNKTVVCLSVPPRPSHILVSVPPLTAAVPLSPMLCATVSACNLGRLIAKRREPRLIN